MTEGGQEREKVSREERGLQWKEPEEAGEVAGEGDRKNESKKRRVVKKREGECIRLKIWQRG